MSTNRITSLDEALAFFEGLLQANPERNARVAMEACLEGRRREHACLSLNHINDPRDQAPAEDEFELPVVEMPEGEEAELARELVGKLSPLKMLNPVQPWITTGQGPGTMVTCFGIPLNPQAENCPAYTKTIDEVLSEPMPDASSAGLLEEIRRKIDAAHRLTPEWIGIDQPDMQGPFNIAHALVGNEALMAPMTDPETFRALMERITTFWIDVRRNLTEWVGPVRTTPRDKVCRICECSVNLVSPTMYVDHILEHDLRIAEAFGPLHIHPCSGPHVFGATWENLPQVTWVEAGYVEKAAAGSIGVDQVMALVGDRQDVTVQVGQELHEGDDLFETIRDHLALAIDHPRMTFGYTAMHLGKAHRPMLREVHRQLDAWWQENVASAQ